MLGSVRDAAGGAWSVLVLDPTTTKVRRWDRRGLLQYGCCPPNPLTCADQS